MNRLSILYIITARKERCKICGGLHYNRGICTNCKQDINEVRNILQVRRRYYDVVQELLTVIMHPSRLRLFGNYENWDIDRHT